MDFVLLSSITSVALLGAISPGPDFAIVVKNSLEGTFRDGIKTSFGIGMALLVHLLYSVFGIALVIQESPVVFHIIRYMGSFYLFYLGMKLFTSKTQTLEDAVITKRKWISSPFLSGFLCNLLNPKASLFILALFSQLLNANTTNKDMIVSMSIMMGVTTLWFVFISFALSNQKIKKQFNKYQRTVNNIMGVLLCSLAIKIAFFTN